MRALTPGVRMDLPVTMKRAAADEDGENRGDICPNDKREPNPDANAIWPAKSVLQGQHLLLHWVRVSLTVSRMKNASMDSLRNVIRVE